MRISVLGAGAMGSFVGGCLATTRAAVTLLDVDAAHIAAINATGLRMTLDAGEQTVRPAAMRPEQLETLPDLVVVLTKQPQTRAALAALAPSLGPATWLLTLQNGLGNQELLEEIVPRDRILLGVTTYPADLIGPGHVGSHGEGEIRLMTADGIHRPIVDEIVALLQASGQHAVADPALLVAIWSKVAFNCAMNSICAVARVTVGQLGANPQGRALALAVADEVGSVARMLDIALDSAKVRATIEHALDTHLTHRPSMLQDILAGRPTEIASINGAVAAIAGRIGHPTPLVTALDTLVRLAETSSQRPASSLLPPPRGQGREARPTPAPP